MMAIVTTAIEIVTRMVLMLVTVVLILSKPWAQATLATSVVSRAAIRGAIREGEKLVLRRMRDLIRWTAFRGEGETSSRRPPHGGMSASCADDPSDVPVAKAGGEVAAVVAREGAAQVSLRVRIATSALEAFAQDGLHGAQVLAAVQGVGDRQLEARQVADVDLRQ